MIDLSEADRACLALQEHRCLKEVQSPFLIDLIQLCSLLQNALIWSAALTQYSGYLHTLKTLVQHIEVFKHVNQIG